MSRSRNEVIRAATVAWQGSRRLQGMQPLIENFVSFELQAAGFQALMPGELVREFAPERRAIINQAVAEYDRRAGGKTVKACTRRAFITEAFREKGLPLPELPELAHVPHLDD